MAVWGLGAQAVILQHRTYLVTAGMAESGHKPSSIGYSPRGCTIRLFVFRALEPDGAYLAGGAHGIDLGG
jgi:hypothetical protein